MSHDTRSNILWTAGVGVAAAGGALLGLWKLTSLRPGPERRSWACNVFGHRGCRFVGDIPENSLPAYQYALDKGSDGIEIDVRLCKTGELVVFHDEYTAGLCLGDNRRVDEMRLDEVRQLQFRENPSVNPPLLEEVLDLCIARNAKLLLEVKHFDWLTCHRAIQPLLRVAERPQYRQFFEERVTLISFNPFYLYLLRRAASWLSVGPLYDDRTITAVAQGVSDSKQASWLWLLCPSLLDIAFAVLPDRVFAPVLGASMTCTRIDMARGPMVERHMEAGRIVYLWGATDHLPRELHNVKVLVACDDAHDTLKLAMPL
jgi:glycerophosphoryl diester phosphodiesterase